MLHEALADYLEKIEQAILHCGNAYVERYIEEIVTSERVNLRIRLRVAQQTSCVHASVLLCGMASSGSDLVASWALSASSSSNS